MNENDTALGTIADAEPDGATGAAGASDSIGGAVPQSQGDNSGSAQPEEGIGSIADDDPGSGAGQPAQEAPEQGGGDEAQGGAIEQEAYTLTPGDEMEFPIQPESLSEFTNVCKGLNMTRRQAQGVLDHLRGKYQADQKWFAQEREQTLGAWQKAIFEDREFGGANYKATIADGRKALKTFDPDGDVRRLLRETGAERHPAVIKLACRIGRAMAEHQYVGGNGAGAGSVESPLWKRIYGASGTEQKHSTY